MIANKNNLMINNNRSESIINNNNVLKTIIIDGYDEQVGNRIIVADEKLYTLILASKINGIVLRDIKTFKRYLNHQLELKKFIEEQVLMYTLIGNIFVPIDYPVRKDGPSFEDFVRFEAVQKNSCYVIKVKIKIVNLELCLFSFFNQ
jgi:hypothetical protein